MAAINMYGQYASPEDEYNALYGHLNNPGANNPAMSMPSVDTNWLMGLPSSQGPSISNPGASAGPNFDPNTFGFNTSAPSGQGLYPGMPQGPGYTLPGGSTNTPPNTTPSIASPSLLATNMGMQGAQNVGGMGMYTGANAPLNTSLFAPQGQDAAIMSGAMGGFGEMMYQAAQQNGINPNISYLQFIDDLSRKTLAAKGGGGGLMPQDFVNYLQSQGGQQWIQGMRPAASQQPQQPTYSQTGPPTQPSAPQLSNPAYPGGRPPGQNQQPGMTTRPVDLSGWWGQGRLDNASPTIGTPSHDGTWGGMYDAQYGPGAYQQMQQNQQQQQDSILRSLGMRRADPLPPGTYRLANLQLDPLGIGIDTRDVVMADGSPVNWQQMTQQYGSNAFGANKTFGSESRPGQNPYQTQGQYPMIGTPGTMMGPGSTQTNFAVIRPGQPGYVPPDPNDPRAQQISQMSYNWHQQNQTPYGQMPYEQFQQISQQQPQFSSDPAMQQAYMYDNYMSQMGGQGQALPQVDFRAATYGGSGGGSSNPSTPNSSPGSTGTGFDFSTLTGQPFTGGSSAGTTSPWANVSNRRSGFGGGSLFGNPYSAPTGNRGTSGGFIGRPASYGGYSGGQSQRPQY